ncbi:hypothetical protein SBY92_001418 [Candida maltosa Xu316]
MSKILHRDLKTTPIIIESSSGNYLYDTPQQQLFDAIGGAAVISVGHNNDEVNQAVIDQLQKVAYIHSGTFTTSISEELATELLENYKSEKLAKVYFANSGSEANEAAIKLVMQYWYESGKGAKCHFISRKQSYHGNCLGGMSLSGHVARRKPYESLIDSSKFHHVSPCFEFRYKKSGQSSAEYVEGLLDELEEEILEIGPENVAAFFAETVVGATTGCVTAAKGYFKGVREICDKYDILLVLDEVMCGSGRTGTFFAWEQEGIVPDITTCGKAISSGASPLSCVVLTEKVLKGLTNGSNQFNCGHTYQSFALSCAAGKAVQKIVKRDGLLQNVTDVGEYLGQQLHDKVLSVFDIVIDVRGRGLFWAIEFGKSKTTNEPFDESDNVASKITDICMNHGVSIYPCKGTVDGFKGDHVIIAPSFTVTKQDIDLIVDAVVKSIQEFIDIVA